MKDLIEDDINGFIVLKSDEYVEKIILLSKNDFLSKKICDNNMMKSLYFDINKVKELYNQIYKC